MSKRILFDKEARTALKKGVDTLANAVKVTLGAKGRNVIIDQLYTIPHITKDGVTVARSIELEDPIENMGAKIVKDVASKTALVAGDGTTTSAVLCQAIFEEGLKQIDKGANPMDLKKGIDIATEFTVKGIANISKKIGDDNAKIKSIATISANNDEEIGSIVAEAFAKIGKSGMVTIEDSKGFDTRVEVVKGMQFGKGYFSPYFVTNPQKMEAVLENPFILICDKHLSYMKDLVGIVEKTMQAGRPLFMIVSDIDGEALATLVTNKVRGILNVVVVQAPEFGEMKQQMLEDISVLTTATVINNDMGQKLEKAGLDQLGSAEKIIVTKNSTVIIGGAGEKEKVEKRISDISAQIEAEQIEQNKNWLQERLAKLSGGIAVIYVGAGSDVELKEKKDRVDDAVRATTAAIAEGVVVGGGSIFLKISHIIEEQLTSENPDIQKGIDVVRIALQAPFKQILSNAGIKYEFSNWERFFDLDNYILYIVKTSEWNQGYNAKTEQIEDLMVSGIIDPAKVLRVALQNASSTTATLLTSECLICEQEPKK